MKVAILNDTHCGTRNSSDIFIEYQRRFYEEVFFPYCLDNDVKTVLHLGDYYEHRKFVNFKALNSNRQHFLNPLKKYGMSMDIIPGNHDVFYKNTNDLCSLKELLGYFTSNVNIIMEPKVLDYDGLKLGVIPWINGENYSKSMDFIANCDASMLGGHFEIEGFEMHKGVANPHGMSPSIFKRFEQVFSGHFHTKSSQGNISYLGSQMEFTWADCEDPKHFHILDTETREVTPVHNPITLFEKIYYDDKVNDYSNVDVEQYANKFVKVIVVNKKDPFLFDKFIDKLQDVETHELKIAETFEEFSGDNVDDDKVSLEDTSELLDSYIEAVETDLDTDRIKSIVRELYVEAQNHEIV